MTTRLIRRLAALAALAALASGCATTGPANPADPFEPVNRAVFEFNDNVDKVTLKPVSQVYNAVLPEVARTGVRNFFANLRDPWIGVNNFMQGKVDAGMSDLFRFVANSTFGFGGLFDIASDMGMEKHDEDFGQTLGVWGVPSGPYLVLPFWGPSNPRDTVGLVVGAYAYVPWYLPGWLNARHEVAWRNGLFIVDLINVRANLLGPAALADVAALDRYTFVRDAYTQRRNNLIYDGNPPPAKSARDDAPVSLDTEATRVPVAVAWVHLAPFASPRLQIVDPKVPANYEAVLAAGRGLVTAQAR